VVGAEHLLAAVLEEESDCARALLRSGVDKQAVLAISEAQHRERPATTEASPVGSSVGVSGVAREFLARAAGVAAAYGAAEVASEHLVVALIWTELGSQVQRVLQDAPGGRPQLAKALRAAGIRVPDAEPPPWPKWGKRLELTPEEAQAQIQLLRDRGQHFMFNWQEGKPVIVVAEKFERR
jgi:ATP-dependent Clp protease ATP-binding subunit ClpA